MRDDLPSGTVTFLFTDIEGSTGLLRELGPERYADALAEHRRVLRQAFAAFAGVEIDTQGDAFFVAFPTADEAAGAALRATEALAEGPVRVRMGLHTGAPTLTGEGYVGLDVHRAARIAALAHGEQIVVSSTTAPLLDSLATPLRDLGPHRLKDFDGPARLFQLGNREFPPLRTAGSVDLPTPATRFVGREQELFDAVSLVYERDPRLLTILGPGERARPASRSSWHASWRRRRKAGLSSCPSHRSGTSTSSQRRSQTDWERPRPTLPRSPRASQNDGHTSSATTSSISCRPRPDHSVSSPQRFLRCD